MKSQCWWVGLVQICSVGFLDPGIDKIHGRRASRACETAQVIDTLPR